MLASEILNWSIRGSILMVAGYLLARLIERRSATIAYRVLVMTLLGTIALPLASKLLPHWTVPAWSTAQGFIPTQLPQVEQSDRHQPPSSGAFSRNVVEVTPTRKSEPADAAPPLPSALPEADVRVVEEAGNRSGLQNLTAAPADKAAIPWGLLGLGIWQAAAVLLGMRLLFYILRLRQLIHACQTASLSLTQRVADIASQLAINTPIRVLTSAPGTMPLACWHGQWTIVVPSNIETWSSDVRQAILAHELGHVARKDAWCDFFVQIASCVLWPHPMTWLLVRRVRKMRERACDEWVLQRSAIDERQYASSVLEVVARCQATICVPLTSAMAGKRDFESRLLWLLSDSRPRTAKPILSATAATSISICGFALATAMPVAPPSGPDQEKATSDQRLQVTFSPEPTPDTPTLSTEGRVIDAETGQPIASAEVVLRAKIKNQQYAITLSHSRDVLARTQTNASGWFAFGNVGIPPRATSVLQKLRRGDGGVEVVAFADGKAVEWVELESFETAGIELSLKRQAEVAGVVLDSEGEPIHNAKLSVRALHAGKSDLDSFVRDPGDLRLFTSELRFEATADSKGRFQLANIPPDYRVSVRCEGPYGHQGFFLVDTGDHEFQTVSFRNASRDIKHVHRTPLRLQTEQQPWTKVRVLDESGQPVRGGALMAVDASRHLGGRADVDRDGTATLVVNQPGPHDVIYGADPLDPRLGARVSVDIQAKRQEPLELRLPKSRTVTGKVVDADTGAPVVGAYVQGPSSIAVVSKSDGTFQIPLPIGESDLRFRHEIDGYFVPDLREAEPVQVTVSDDGPLESVVMKVARGLVIRGELQNERGRPLAGVSVTATSEGRPFRSVAARTDEHGRFVLAGLAPDRPARVVATTRFGAAEKLLAAEPNYPLDETLVRTVKLTVQSGTTLTGRVVADGKPMPGVTMKLSKAPPGDAGTRYSFFGETETDADGRYSMSGLKKGERYRFEVVAPGDLQVRDWQHQSPYVQTIDVEDGETVELPDAVLLKNNQILRGVVVDPEGDPVAEATVSASLASGGMLSRPLRGTVPWTKTDAQGRFTLTNLPDKPIQLKAYRVSRSGGRIRYPATLEPELNDDDIRVVLDPSLGSGIENLD